MRSCIQHVVRLSALNGDAGHVFHFPPCRLTAQDPGLSSRGMRVRLPSRRPFSLRKRRLCSEIGVRFALSDLIEASRRPESGKGRVSMRSWRRSNAPVCQSGVGSAILPERTIWSCGV